MSSAGPIYQTVFTDTGGTFTDTFVVDAEGKFEVAKASTTPQDLSVGFFDSLEAVAKRRDRGLSELCSQVAQIGYGSTTAINAVLTRRGQPLGLIITRGFEHLLLMQRGVQTYTEYDLTDRLHPRTHRPVEPLVPQNRVFGVTERIDSLGQVIVPLYATDVERAAYALLDEGVQAIVVVLLFSWMNPSHELAVKEMILSIAKRLRRNVEVYLSHEVSPIGRELPRCNDTLIEAYTRPVVMNTLKKIQSRLRDQGYRGELHVMQSTGGVTTVGNLKVIHTLESGPVGGIMGALYMGETYGLKDIITTDVGGTSFDVGMVSRGTVEVEQEPVCARMVLGVPMVAVHSVGAGGGTIARIDPLTGRLMVGPESAGADPGPACYGRGGTEPTVTDADLVLGYLNPDRFLGGKVNLDPERAAQAIGERIAGPLNLSLADAAAGINAIVDARMQDTIVGMVMSRGFDIGDYDLLAFGGAGPSHVAAYTAGLALKDILVFPFSSVFCAFGAACSDYVRNYTRSVNLVAPRDADDALKRQLSDALAATWLELRQRAEQEMSTHSGHELRMQYRMRMRYGRQLDQILVHAPVVDPACGVQWDTLVDAFERTYSAMYSASARFPQAGYEIVEASVLASAPQVKPRLPMFPLGDHTAPPEARNEVRKAYFERQWMETSIYDWDRLNPGNLIEGPAIVEEDTQTLVVPPGWSARMDEYRAIHLSSQSNVDANRSRHGG